MSHASDNNCCTNTGLASRGKGRQDETDAVQAGFAVSSVRAIGARLAELSPGGTVRVPHSSARTCAVVAGTGADRGGPGSRVVSRAALHASPPSVRRAPGWVPASRSPCAPCQLETIGCFGVLCPSSGGSVRGAGDGHRIAQCLHWTQSVCGAQVSLFQVSGFKLTVSGFVGVAVSFSLAPFPLRPLPMTAPTDQPCSHDQAVHRRLDSGPTPDSPKKESYCYCYCLQGTAIAFRVMPLPYCYCLGIAIALLFLVSPLPYCLWYRHCPTAYTKR